MIKNNFGKIKRKITLIGVLKYISDNMDIMFPMDRRSGYNLRWKRDWPDWDDYFPSRVILAANRLERKGLVTRENTPDGIKIKITDKGKTEVFKYDIENWQPKTEQWDGKWRLVLFDVEEKKRWRRLQLINYLKKLGMQELQKSVYITPYDVEKEIKYLREILEVPNNIKVAIVERIENEEEIKEIFDI